MGAPRQKIKAKLLTLFFVLAAISLPLLPASTAQQSDAIANLAQEVWKSIT